MKISLMMSTATPMVSPSGYIYSVMQQGAGLANVSDAMNAATFITMHSDATVSAADGKVKAELGDDPEKTGVYSFGFTMTNISKNKQTYNLSADVFTQATDGDFLYESTTGIPANVTFLVNGQASNTVTVKKNGSANIQVVITLADSAKEFFDTTLVSGAYVEAYIHADAADGKTASHSIPVLVYYGSWTDASMFDQGSYVDYKFGYEDKLPYLNEYNGTAGNFYTVSLDGGEYYFAGNLYASEKTYDPARNALNSRNGDAYSVYNTYYGAYVDIFYLLDNAGNLYQEGFVQIGDQYGYFFGEADALMGRTDITADTSYFQSLYYDGQFLFASCFNESENSVTLYAIDIDNTGAIFSMGTFADGVWPIAGLIQVAPVNVEAPESASALIEAQVRSETTSEFSQRFEMTVTK